MRRRRTWSLLLTSLVAISLVNWTTPAGTANAASPEGFADSQIRSVWQRDDGPVASGAVQRPWLWGPGPFHTDYEPYTETPNGNHLVQYFDKGRLEINDPGGDKGSSWYVTSGLLVKEMVSGAAQVGDHELYRIGPAGIPVAGDENATQTPTYATFAGLTGRAQSRDGQVVNSLLGANGQVIMLQATPTQVTAARYEQASGHNWASVFWQFVTSASRPARFDWLRTLGYPITEPYWVNTTVSGKSRVVLVQLFERRVLTYNPSNPDSTKVEMGNVGRHYYTWRYKTLNTANLDARYDVRIIVGSAPRRATSVSETVDFANNTGSTLSSAVFRAIWHHWDGVFTLDSATYDGTGIDMKSGIAWQNDVDLRVKFPDTLAPGQRAKIGLSFSLAPRPVGGRSAVDRTYDILTLGDMLPTLVPFENGGWASYPYSELGDHGYYTTSSYTVHLNSTGGERLIIGGTGKITSVDGGRTRYVFSAPNVRDVAYVISPRFMDPLSEGSLVRKQDGVTVRAYFLSGHATQAQRQLDLVLPAFGWFSRTVGAYPFEDFTIAEMGVPLERTDDYAQEYPMSYYVPSNWLALGTTAGSWTWYNPVHETGHQWFYSTIGSNQLTDPWLDEAMTSYMTTEYVRANFPDVYSKVYGETVAGASAPKPVSSGVFSGFASENEYTHTVYDKAVAMLDRVRRAMGNDAFYAAIRDYYSKFKLKRAAPSDLTGILQAHSSADLGGIFSTYLGY